MTTDVIDQLVGIAPGDALDTIRSQRPNARENAQASFDALFTSDELDEVSQLARLAIAYWTLSLSGSASAPFYRELLVAENEATAEILDKALAGAVTTGPYGDYPEGPLSTENAAGLHWEPDAALTAAVGPRLVSALAHTHLLVYRPRDSSAEALQALLDAGWSTTGIVTISQLVAFLSFQLRVVQGLTVLKGAL
jgi:CMD domain protein